MTKVNALVNEVVSTSVLSLHEVENLSLCESLDTNLEFLQITISNGFHQR
jgi:hypothetical protein